jgi:hypothetical protein
MYQPQLLSENLSHSKLAIGNAHAQHKSFCARIGLSAREKQEEPQLYRQQSKE